MGKMHCLNSGCSDATIIVSENYTFLVDCHNIADFTHLLPASKYIHAVFITHQHHDHFSGLEYLKENDYKIGFLIYSPYKRRLGDDSVELDEWNEFCGYRDYFESQGTDLRAPYRQTLAEEGEAPVDPYWKIDGLKFWMLGPTEDLASATDRCLHNACLVFRLDLSSSLRVTFTGDASDCLLGEIANTTINYCDGILHASHHGSINGANEHFIKGSKATQTVISTKPGAYSNIPHPTAIARYEANTPGKVYRTDEGTWSWSF